jgi:hypothetical protein
LSDRAIALARALCAAVVGFDLGFVFPAWSPTRVLWYFPLERRWAFVVRPDGLAMDFYGRTLLALLVAAACFALALTLARVRPPSRPSLQRWTSWAAIALALTLALQAFQLANRQPVPEPLPAWYVPR